MIAILESEVRHAPPDYPVKHLSKATKPLESEQFVRAHKGKKKKKPNDTPTGL
jgi:hypothetical protein